MRIGPARRHLDEQDEAIISRLREDGRMSVRELAAELQLNEATVRARIRRLEQSGAMRVVARLDLASIGYPFTALVGLKIRGRSVADVGADLLKKRSNGTMSATVTVPSDYIVAFRYLGENGTWFDETEADFVDAGASVILAPTA